MNDDVLTRSARSGWSAYAGMLGVFAITFAVAWAAHHVLDPSNLVMVFLLGVLVSAAAFGRGPGVVASLLSVAVFDYFFVPPFYTFAVSDTQYLVTFGVMLLTALTVNTLASRMRSQTEEARERERRTAALYRLSRELAGTGTLESALATVASVTDGAAVLLLPDEHGNVTPRAGESFGDEAGVAQRVFDHREPAAAAHGLYLPLQGVTGTVGVIGVCPSDPRRLQDPRQVGLLEAIASQIALALERSRLAGDAERARIAAETERMRNALLSSVSHDLRTPLASITGAATSLRDDSALPADVRSELAATIAEESDRLNRLVTNLLDMTRLESGAFELARGWHSIEELIGAALGRLEPALDGRPVHVDVPAGLPLVALDDVLVEQALYNLLDNAVKHTSSPIDIAARVRDGALAVSVADRGAGLPAGDVFRKFARGPSGGSGLGLAIVRAIAEAHGGTVVAAPRDGGGTTFTLTIPSPGEAPTVVAE